MMKRQNVSKNNIYILLIKSSSDTKKILNELNILHRDPNGGFYINYGIDKDTVKTIVVNGLIYALCF